MLPFPLWNGLQGLVDLWGRSPSEIPGLLEQKGCVLIQEHLLHIIDYAKRNKDKADKSWPVLLKSNAFFGHITAYLAGIRQAKGSSSMNLRTVN